MEGLTSRVLDERQPATIKWLAYSLKIPSNKAIDLLEEFVNKQKVKPDAKLEVTYLIAGKSSDPNSSHIVRIVSSKDLEKAEQEIVKVSSKHIYAVQVSGSANVESDLWNVDHNNLVKIAHDNSELGNSFFKNERGLISYPNIKVNASSNRHFAPPPQSIKKPATISSVYQNAAATSKIKNVTSAASFFGTKSAKPSNGAKKVPEKKKVQEKEKKANPFSKKTSKSKNPKDQKGDVNDNSVIIVDESNNDNSVVNVDESKKVGSEKQTEQKRKRKIIDSDDEDEEFEFGEDNKKDKAKGKEKKRKKTFLTEEEKEELEKEKQEQKRQKREEEKEQRRVEREEMKKAEKKEAKHRFAESLGAVQVDKPQGKVVKRMKQVLTTKTYEDENGYLVTKDVYEEVEVEEIEPDVQEVKAQDTKPNVAVKPVKPVKKAKQSNMLSFFKKKPAKK